ncbi:MAG: ABC transporter permease, partial [Dethiobacteria bacterium]
MNQLTVLLTNQVFADGGKSFFAGQNGAASLLTRTITYLLRRSDIVWELLLEHIWLIVVSISIAIVISVLVGVIISYKTGPAVVVLTICQILMTIPSMAMLAFMVPIFGIGFTTGVVALILYSLLPIVRNTYTGIK